MHVEGRGVPHRNSVRELILAGIGGILLGVLFFPVVASLSAQWWNDANYRHGVLVPIIAVWMFYRRWSVLGVTRSADGALAGWTCILAAGALLLGGTAAGELLTARFSLPTFLIGLSLLLRGWAFTKKAAFPLFFLYMMIPLPYIIYYKIAFPLQLMSARLSADVLGFLDVNVIRRGNILLLPNYSLEVVAACSGLRSLMTMVTLSLIIGAFGELPTRRRWVLVLFAVPAAIGANMARLVITALGAYLVSSAFADGFLHTFSGLVVFMMGFLLLILVYLGLRRIR